MAPSVRQNVLTFVLGFLCFMQLAQAASTVNSLPSSVGISSSPETCSTSYGMTKVSPVPRKSSLNKIQSTTTTTGTVVYVKTITSTPSSTAVITSVVTSTAVSTTPAVTDTTLTTAILTSTSLTDTTSTTTSTTTVTTTVTSTTSTLNVPASAGYTAIQSEPAVVHVGGAIRKKRGLNRYEKRTTMASSSYAASVTCTSAQITITTYYDLTTSTSTSTITAPTTTITTTTMTTAVTSTGTTLPDSTATSITSTTTGIISTTNTVVTTAVVTSTSTITSNVVATAYAVCEDSSNYITCLNNGGINNAFANAGSSTLEGSTADAHACCVLCAQDSSCGASAYDIGAGNCYSFPVNGVCDPRADVGYFFTSAVAPAFNISNSNCGQAEYAGSD